MTIQNESSNGEDTEESTAPDKDGGIEFVRVEHPKEKNILLPDEENIISSNNIEKEKNMDTISTNNRHSHPHDSIAENDTTSGVELDSNNTQTTTTTHQEQPNEIPPVCYCPITKQIMHDPVVNREGDSFEKSAVMMEQGATATSSRYYPNRALKAYIEREVERANHNTNDKSSLVMGTLRRLDEQLRTGWDQLAIAGGVGGFEYRPLPDAFYCPITFELPKEPVIDADGYTYEKFAIERWIRKNHDSPVTRKSLLMSELYNNNAVLSILLHESVKTEDQDTTIHPSLRRWKEELQSPSPLDEFPTTDEEYADHHHHHHHNHNHNHNDPARFVVVIPRGHPDYPTTPEELQDRVRRQRRQRRTTMFAFFFVVAIIAVSFFYLPFYLIAVVLGISFMMYCRLKLFYDATMQ